MLGRHLILRTTKRNNCKGMDCKRVHSIKITKNHNILYNSSLVDCNKCVHLIIAVFRFEIISRVCTSLNCRMLAVVDLIPSLTRHRSNNQIPAVAVGPSRLEKCAYLGVVVWEINKRFLVNKLHCRTSLLNAIK